MCGDRHPAGMDVVRLGLSLRALRRRRSWTQAELAATSGVSRALVSKLETGGAGTMQLNSVEAIAAKLGARFEARIAWHGEEIDRLLDRAHARLVELTVQRLIAAGWQTVVEATFQIAGERGSIDVLAFHAMTRTLLVIEVKSVVPDVQALLAGLDRKARLATKVAAQRGWQPAVVARLLVLPAGRTARRRLASFGMTFDAVLPARSAQVKRWIAKPVGVIHGILLVPDSPGDGGRHRVRSRKGSTHAQAMDGTLPDARKERHLTAPG